MQGSLKICPVQSLRSQAQLVLGTWSWAYFLWCKPGETQLLGNQLLIYTYTRNTSFHMLNSRPGASCAQSRVAGDDYRFRQGDWCWQDGWYQSPGDIQQIWFYLLTEAIDITVLGGNGSLLRRLLKPPPGYTEKRCWQVLIRCSRQISVEILANKINPRITPWVSFRNQQQKDVL